MLSNNSIDRYLILQYLQRIVLLICFGAIFTIILITLNLCGVTHTWSLFSALSMVHAGWCIVAVHRFSLSLTSNSVCPPHHLRELTSIPFFYPLDASNTPHPLSCDSPKYLQILPNVPGSEKRAKSSPDENY